jgi:hypothetical protein
MMTLTELANRIGTDKGTQTGAAHGYALVYDMLLAPLRDRPGLELLEMGLAIGGPELGGDVNRSVPGAPSVAMWLEFFADARVTGFDISDFSAVRHDRFRFLRGDSGKREDVERLRRPGRGYDVILDDAAHRADPGRIPGHGADGHDRGDPGGGGAGAGTADLQPGPVRRKPAERDGRCLQPLARAAGGRPGRLARARPRRTADRPALLALFRAALPAGMHGTGKRQLAKRETGGYPMLTGRENPCRRSLVAAARGGLLWARTIGTLCGQQQR